MESYVLVTADNFTLLFYEGSKPMLLLSMLILAACTLANNGKSNIYYNII